MLGDVFLEFGGSGGVPSATSYLGCVPWGGSVGGPVINKKHKKTTKNGTPSPETPSRPSPSWACSEGLPDRSFRGGEGGEDGGLRGPVPGGGQSSQCS